MLKLEIKNDVLKEGSTIFFKGAALELTRYEGQELQVNTFLYFEKDGVKSQFISYNHCDVEKNISLEKTIVCEDVDTYTFPEETRKNQIIYYAPGTSSKVSISQLSQKRNEEYFDGAFEKDCVAGCEYFAFLRTGDTSNENEYMVLLSTKNLKVVLRAGFMQLFGIDVETQKDALLFEKVFVPGKKITVRGSYLGIVKISDIYATETYTYFEQDGQKYQYYCLEKFDECRDAVVHNTRFFRQCNLSQVEQYTIPAETEYAMTDYYLPVDAGIVTLKEMKAVNYGKYVPFSESDINVTGCSYFAVTMKNRAEKQSEKVLYTIVEAYKKTRYKKFARIEVIE